jgi:hypothetical protein
MGLLYLHNNIKLVLLIVVVVSCKGCFVNQLKLRREIDVYSDDLNRITFKISKDWTFEKKSSLEMLRFKKGNSIRIKGVTYRDQFNLNIKKKIGGLNCKNSPRIIIDDKVINTRNMHVCLSSIKKEKIGNGYKWTGGIQIRSLNSKNDIEIQFYYFLYTKEEKAPDLKFFIDFIRNLKFTSNKFDGGKDIPYELLSNEWNKASYFRDTLSVDTATIYNLDMFPEMEGLQKPDTVILKPNFIIDNYEIISDCYKGIERTVTFQVFNGEKGAVGFRQTYCKDVRAAR